MIRPVWTILLIGLAAAVLLAGPLSAGVYRGNHDSLIFHDASCRHYHCKACTVEFKSRDEALARGYRPCRVCKP